MTLICNRLDAEGKHGVRFQTPEWRSQQLTHTVPAWQLDDPKANSIKLRVTMALMKMFAETIS